MPPRPAVLVTGASSGIGRACVDAFLAQGARVIAAVAARSAWRNCGTSTTTRLLLARWTWWTTQVNDALGSLPDGWSPIDVLVNNAGPIRLAQGPSRNTT